MPTADSPVWGNSNIVVFGMWWLPHYFTVIVAKEHKLFTQENDKLPETQARRMEGGIKKKLSPGYIMEPWSTDTH